MLELAAPLSPVSFDERAIDERSDAELDALPFGVIGLDEEGTILRYNLYESRFARLDRNQVVGRNFFAEVAHCTRNEAFQGRFLALVGAGEEAETVRFAFLFDFAFGAQHVLVEMVRARGARRFYLLVNRLRIEAPRADFPPEQLAAVQRQLVPDEERWGVRRDALERRFVDAPAPFFAALRATCERLAPDTWQIFASEWGVEWGRRAAVDLEASALEQGGRPLRDLTMREVAQLVAAYFADHGWGSPAFDFAPAAEGVLVVELSRSALAEAAPRAALGLRSGAVDLDLACHLFAGCVSAILSAVAGRRLAAREVACSAAGAACCAIVVVAHERRSSVDAALGAGVRGVEPIRAALRRAPRAPASER